MCKHDVIHKTGNTKCIATPPDEDRATDVANVHKKFGEDRTCSSGHVLADRETDRQTDTVITILRSPIGGGGVATAVTATQAHTHTALFPGLLR